MAGDLTRMAWLDGAELRRDSALAIARHLDRPMRARVEVVKHGLEHVPSPRGGPQLPIGRTG